VDGSGGCQRLDEDVGERLGAGVGQERVETSTHQVRDLILVNLDPALVGCATAIRRFLAADTPGAIVNVSSHQARQAVPGCLPYATAKAATEGMTRALAVEYGPRGIRVNAVAPGTIATEPEW
jgi:NAD(P)-dependent dehydrogenase (short-subunit alcohol dehydrogenase family)